MTIIKKVNKEEYLSLVLKYGQPKMGCISIISFGDKDDFELFKICLKENSSIAKIIGSLSYNRIKRISYDDKCILITDINQRIYMIIEDQVYLEERYSVY